MATAKSPTAAAAGATGATAVPLPNVEVPSNDIRFQIELEFIQCLASPAYLNFLAINRYFDNPAFMNYLAYLKYWKQPQYAKYLVYPHSLAFLDMLDDERFRQMIQREDFMTLVHSQQFYHWQTFLNNRSGVPPPSAAAAADTGASGSEQGAAEFKE
ncbi:hypothetical protein PybrP1_008637 [[Pythium] brassicae (nom. inval.)]|nr:hypothetical protein PybrP1_008637 [[Pythium] brassicae (nom. inval.)]